MTNTKMTLVDWLDDLCVRFIVNLPNEELQSVERICFQIEEAQWFYEDFIRPLDPNNLPSMHLRKFSQLMFQHCPLFSAYSEELHQQAYENFLAYKTRVPVRGAIMLNEDMTHAVLVKGWKKGAKWSFPRGKINKEEADLDCAVREVWEETGYDLQAANLVLPEEKMKHITVTMREQSMMLYVFRGVPMDTYFEPRTRKEISKIDWYKLTDLPTLRRKNQVQQQVAGQDMIKESSFYMVAPFLGPLRHWIKQQHKLDRQQARNSAHLAPSAGMLVTDEEEEVQVEIHATTAGRFDPDSAPQPDLNFADLVAQLGRGHRPSDTLPEVSMHLQAEQSVDPAAELKRLLSVGIGFQSPPVEAPNMPTPTQQTQANSLLALFQQGNNKPASPQASLPRTPFDQVMSPPIQPDSPHGQHHPRPPQFNNMAPPPPFPFPSHQHQGMPFHGSQPQFNNGMHGQIPHQFMPQPPPQNRAMFQSPQQMPNPQGPPPFHPSNDNQSYPSAQSQPFGSHGPGPVVPPASKLPAPKLNAHTLGLLDSFRISDQRAPEPGSSQTTVHAQSPRMAHEVQQESAPRHTPNELASPQFQSPPISIQPAQPKPRSAHQDSLLTIFRSTPPISSPEPTEPAELSALPTTPGYVSAQLASKTAKVPNVSLLDMFGNQPKPPGITSATVRGPVNAPDFDTMKKHTLPTSGSSRGPSPATFVPQQILKREQSVPRSPSDIKIGGRNGISPSNTERSSTPQTAFKPQILKRPQQSVSTTQSPAPGAGPATTAHAKSLLDMFKGPSPQPAVSATKSPVPFAAMQQSTNRRESVPSDQKNTLLALFNKPSPKPEGSRVPAPLQQTRSPVPAGRSPLPPTPKTVMSGVISPVSPLPEKGSQAASPSDMTSRSRISSIGDSAPPSIVIPPTSHPVSRGQIGENMAGVGSTGGLGAQNRSATDGKSPLLTLLPSSRVNLDHPTYRLLESLENVNRHLPATLRACDPMKLFVLLLLALVAIAATVSTPHHDGLLEVPSTSVAEAQNKAMFNFKWTTMDYCGDDGSLRATGNWSTNGFSHVFEIDGPRAMLMKVSGEYLQMVYDFDTAVTNFQYRDCKWGQQGASCGMCHRDDAWNGPKPDCASTEKNFRYREFSCSLQVKGFAPGKRDPKDANSIASQAQVEPAAFDNTLVLSDTDVTSTAPVTQHADAHMPVTAGTEGRVGYIDFSLSVTEFCEASLGTPLKAKGYWMITGSDSPGLGVDFDDGHQATSINIGYPGTNLLVGPYDYYKSVVGLHYGGCHWDQDIRGFADCGYCTSTSWSSSDLNCAMNPAAGRTHQLECKVAVEWDNPNSLSRSKNAARHDNTIIVDRRKRIANDTVEDLKATRTLVPEVIATQTTLNSETTILAFHYTLTEYCESGKRLVKGYYQNGNIQRDMDLPPGLINAIIHLVPNFPPLEVGPYKYDTNHLRFAYNGTCEWADDETWKTCGECRAALWSGSSLDCAVGGSRTKEMDCSFILGKS
ncbi:hypothetical protein DE146DRAFT_760032 [Phaeosphaeria sp. MPI-PUGE-AT-0046c]|nr:hypothetical protein DE146DRAFT_760032 [Phaeosphaeria sp. MPI-PUGE-AT-0046c]